MRTLEERNKLEEMEFGLTNLALKCSNLMEVFQVKVSRRRDMGARVLATISPEGGEYSQDTMGRLAEYKRAEQEATDAWHSYYATRKVYDKMHNLFRELKYG